MGLRLFFNNISKLDKEFVLSVANTPGNAGGPGGRDQTLAVQRRKNTQKSALKKIKYKF